MLEMQRMPLREGRTLTAQPSSVDRLSYHNSPVVMQMRNFHLMLGSGD